MIRKILSLANIIRWYFPGFHFSRREDGWYLSGFISPNGILSSYSNGPFCFLAMVVDFLKLMVIVDTAEAIE